MYKIIGADHKEYGPVTSDQLRQWFSEGRINGQTRVQGEGTGVWKPISELPEFAGLFPAASATPPPSPPPPPPPGMTSMAMPPSGRPVNSQMAIWSMVVGLVAMFCCQIFLGPLAIILGFLALSKIKANPNLTGSGFAIAGVVTGILALLILLVIIVFLKNHPDFMQNLQNQMPH